jgi:hypothetical protein
VVWVWLDVGLASSFQVRVKGSGLRV